MMTRRIAAACALGAIVASSASAQVDARWRAWTGCWSLAPEMSQLGAKSTVCVVPTEKPSAIEILSIVSGKVTDRTRVDADGQPHTTTADGCTSTEMARWSPGGTRVYITENVKCGDAPERRGTGIMSFTQQYSWLDVRGISAGAASGVAVARYDVVSEPAGLPEEAVRAINSRGTGANNSTLAASAPLTLADIAEVATTTDSGVAATWLMERTKNVTVSLDAKQLVALADQGAPASVIDVLVAISHPRVFALNTGGPAVREQTKQTSSANLDNSYWRRYPRYYGGYSSAFYDPWYGLYDPFFDPYYYRSRYGYSAYGAYGAYGYGYGGGYSPYIGYYPGSQPIIVVNRPAEDSRPHGRVVNGRGYTSGSSGSSGSSSSPSSSRTSSSSSGSSSSGSASSGASSGTAAGSSSSGGDRTAVRKPPQ